MSVSEQDTNTHAPTADAPHVVIVGGGISGLSAAWYLQQAGGVRVTLIEASDRWGGKIHTEHVHGYADTPFIVEGGPDSFITQKPWAHQLATELGISDRVLGTNDERRKTYVLNNGRLTPLPDGVLLIIPTRFMPFALSPLISIPGKMRMGLEMFVPTKDDDEDESLADFVRRRLGQEALDKLAEPLMAGIYNTDAEDQSLMATFPRFRQLERKYGNLTRGMIASRRNRPPSKGPKLSTFASFHDGLSELVDALVSQLTADMRAQTSVTQLDRDGEAWTVTLDSGETLHADHVILTTPTGVAADLLRPHAPEAADIVGAIEYVSTGTVTLAYKTVELNHPLDGFGVVIPRSAKRDINAVTWSSTKFSHRAPEGHALLRVFFGGARSPQSLALDDEALVATVRRELADIMGVTAEPLFHRVYRWNRATPQYAVGHHERMDALDAVLPDGVHLTGSAYRGIGIPDCVNQAKQTAAQVAARLTE